MKSQLVILLVVFVAAQCIPAILIPTRTTSCDDTIIACLRRVASYDDICEDTQAHYECYTCTPTSQNLRHILDDLTRNMGLLEALGLCEG